MAGTVISSKATDFQILQKNSNDDGHKHPGWVYPFIVLLVGALAYIPWLGSYGLLDPTDSFFLESGRESIEKSQYLLPLNNYVPWLDKPILFFWMVAGSYKLFGINAFAGRLPVALSAILTAILIYTGSRPMLKQKTAALAALIFLATPLCSMVGHLCLTDMTLCALFTGTVLFLFKGWEYKSKKDLILGYLFLGLAMLCKGPIAIILCGLTMLPFIFLDCKNSAENKKQDSKNTLSSFKQQFLRLNPLTGVTIVLALNMPWYVMASIATRGLFLLDFFWTQNFGRMVGTVNHQQPFYFYIPIFLGGFFPWCALTLSAPGLIRKTFSAAGYQSDSAHRRLIRISCCWFISVIALFSAIKTKLPTYILPSVPALAILVALQLETLAKAGRLRRLASLTTFMTVVLLTLAAVLVLVLVFGTELHPMLKLLLKPILKPVQSGYIHDIIIQNIWMAAPLAISLLSCWVALYRKNSKLYACSLLAFSLVICGLLIPRGMIVAYDEHQKGFNRLSMRARDDGASVAMIFAEEPSVPWFTHKPVSRLKSPEDAQRFMQTTAKPHYVLVQKAGLPRLDWFSGPSTTLETRGKWHLINVDKL